MSDSTKAGDRSIPDNPARVGSSLLARLLLFSMLLFGSPAIAQDRTVVPLASGWRFAFGVGSDAPSRPEFADGTWQTVSLPHTWNNVGFDGQRRPARMDDRRGQGWYRLKFTAPDLRGRRAWLEFDAVSIVADVWLNGRHLGRHEGAFSRFRLDATAALKSGADNLLVVRADNSRPVPGSATRYVQPIYGGFMMYGGMYRPARLLLVDPLHVDLADHGGPGVYATATDITTAAATVAVRTRISNDAGARMRGGIVTRILAADGRPVTTARAAIDMVGGETQEATSTLRLPTPHLWNGREDPYLYRVEVSVEDAQGRVRDRVVQPLGVRTMRIDPDTGFWLNGVNTPLHGVARHQDRAEKGWAVSPSDEREDMALIAEMGANTIRFSHYNHSEHIHDLTDQIGLVAWAELGLLETHLPVGDPDVTAQALDSAKLQLRELIRQNYNHPSIAVWGIGNEVTRLMSIRILPPRPVRAFMAELDKVAHEEDPSRPTTIALCCEPNERFEQLVGVADVAGYNQYKGWYDGGYAAGAANLGGEMRALHAAHATLPLALSEYGAGGAVTQYTDNPTGGPVDFHGRPQPLPVMNLIHEESWREIRSLPFLWGTWVWNMFDFANPLRTEGDSIDINTKGLVTFDRKTRKDSFYFYKAVWSDRPVVHITDGFYTDRAYPVLDVKVYSNAPEVHLRVGSAPARSAPCVDGVCLFPGVRLAPGDNAVTARAGFFQGEQSDTVHWTFAGDPRSLRILAGTLSGLTARGGRFGSDDFFQGGVGQRLNVLRSRSYIQADVDVDKADWRPAPVLAVAATEPGLYESYREGSFNYVLPVPDGRYRVSLGFAEPHDKKAGERIFDVIADGRMVLRHFDIVRAAGGPRQAVVRSFAATARQGRVLLTFKPEKGEAIVSNIVVRPAP